MKNIAAFFDIDGTLYREGLISEVFKKLLKYEIIQPEKWFKELKPYYEKYDKRQGNYDNYLLKMANIYTEEIVGLRQFEIERVAKKVIKEKGDRVYTFTRDRIEWHKNKNHIVLTISGSPEELVREMAIKYGFYDYKGAKYLTDDNNVYTGQVIPMWDSTSKQKAVFEFTEKYNLDLSKSFAYGDTSGDFSMMELVGNPVCVNPTKELIEKITESDKTRENAKIVVERKDMIYTFTSSDNYLYKE